MTGEVSIIAQFTRLTPHAADPFFLNAFVTVSSQSAIELELQYDTVSYRWSGGKAGSHCFKVLLVLLYCYLITSRRGRRITRETREGRREDQKEKSDETERRDGKKDSI